MTMKKIIAGVAAASVLTVGAGAAMAAQQSPQETTGTQAAQQQEQEPSFNGSVAAPETEANDATENPGNDAAEAKQLEGLARIDQPAAEGAALGAVPGKVQQTELDNENGSVVYSVEILGQDGKLQEVVVDAGDGKVLAQGAEEDEGPVAGEATK